MERSVQVLSLLLLSGALLYAEPQAASAQTPTDVGNSRSLVGQRVVILNGFGDTHRVDDNGMPKPAMSPEALVANGHNIVAAVRRVEGDRVWVDSTGGGDLGWVARTDVILLQDAISYFDGRIARDPNDWDSYFRKADAEHALNQRAQAINDYGKAIELHPDDPFLYMRRGRSYRSMKSCLAALADFHKASELDPKWAEPYSMQAGVYSGCADPAIQNLDRATELISKAIELDPQHPTYLTVLAECYERSGRFAEAVLAQKKAIESPVFPPAYRDGAIKQLEQYQEAARTHAITNK